MNLDKPAIIRKFIAHFEHELALIRESAKAAHEAATHEEAKSEDKHDTRAIEAGYLAQGQAKRVMELEDALNEFKHHLESTRPHKVVEKGALITLELDGKISHSFFAGLAGGTQIKFDDQRATVVTMVTEASPLGQMLVGCSTQDEVEVETKNGVKTYRVKAIW